MSFDKSVLIPLDRIGVLIGKTGKVKSRIEKICSVKITVDSESGEILVSGNGQIEDMLPFKAVEVVMAIGRGFSPEKAMRLLQGENALHVIDLREFAGKSSSNIERIKGRIIGEGGRVRQNIEELSGANISVYGRTVSIIGEGSQLKHAVDAISALSRGSMHGAVYNDLQEARRREKQDKLQLWENGNVFD
ncbi:MAG: KH domain-containing protein [Nitrosopumilaceae archaeon]